MKKLSKAAQKAIDLFKKRELESKKSPTVILPGVTGEKLSGVKRWG